MLQQKTHNVMAESWSQAEVEIIVADYFQMLTEEIAGKPFNKAQHRRALLPLLNNRNESSIEFKHQNISAVLAKLGLPYINGYKPAWNYQKLLEQVVIAHVSQHRQLENSFQLFADAAPNVIESNIKFDLFVEEAPTRQPVFHDVSSPTYRTIVKKNYIELEQANKIIGTSGEKLVMDYEKWRLINEGKESLVDKIEWVSQQGDGHGFDILSKNSNGSDRYIEVKSTKLTKEAPFFFSKNEFDFSADHRTNYYLYRVFNLRQDPKLFIHAGSFDELCNYEAVNFKGYF